jgi:hypothetical protein
MGLLITVALCLFAAPHYCKANNLENEPKHRVVILADMGNEPDEEQQMVHMLMYSSEFESQMPILPL